MRAWILAALLAATSSAGAQTPSVAPAQPAIPKCDRPENRQFDFWVGHWQVFDTNDKSLQGESRIEALYDGCTIRENWRDPRLIGGSLNTYVTTDSKWHQLWTDSSGAWREFIGGMVGKEMILIAKFPSVRVPGQMVQARMTFTPNPDGSVRQHSVRSTDGISWTEGYDYTYRRVPG